uniref:Predicted protein n=1 Tax=Hordeum vulgare subsp. vulgare TaxID=112509 RepID=F2EBX4_HORVV|nr:predicted protein [Hordeum vulgare subsp. vulgare]
MARRARKVGSTSEFPESVHPRWLASGQQAQVAASRARCSRGSSSRSQRGWLAATRQVAVAAGVDAVVGEAPRRGDKRGVEQELGVSHASCG